MIGHQGCGLDSGAAPLGMLRSIATGSGSPPPQSLTYDYEANGNVHTIADTRTGETSEFTYDALDRVTRGWSSLFDEYYSYSEIGNRTKTGESRTYPTSPAVRPHAPTVVAGESYTYDDNGGLTAADSRGYEYDVENRLERVRENSTEIKFFTYDGDSVLRTMSASGTLTTRYVTADYQVNVPTGEATLYYSFGGRTIAWHDDSTLRYLLTDHLGSSHGEASDAGTDVAQRRYLPFGGDRAVTGANNLTRDERYTGQKRIDDGNGEARRELYHYGARWYLPGVGIFTQPDTVVPNPGSPQDLNRYSYVKNNPLAHTDSTGHSYLDDAGGGGTRTGNWWDSVGDFFAGQAEGFAEWFVGPWREEMLARGYVGADGNYDRNYLESIGMAVSAQAEAEGQAQAYFWAAGSIRTQGGAVGMRSPGASTSSRAPKGKVDLFRSVSQPEEADIRATGGFRPEPGGRSMAKAKLFATSAEDAAWWGKNVFRIARE